MYPASIPWALREGRGSCRAHRRIPPGFFGAGSDATHESVSSTPFEFQADLRKHLNINKRLFKIYLIHKIQSMSQVLEQPFTRWSDRCIGPAIRRNEHWWAGRAKSCTHLF